MVKNYSKLVFISNSFLNILPNALLQTNNIEDAILLPLLETNSINKETFLAHSVFFIEKYCGFTFEPDVFELLEYLLRCKFHTKWFAAGTTKQMY